VKPVTPAFLPTRAQELLLEACLLEREEALDAWREWREQLDLDRLDMGSVRLLPLLAARLGEAGVDDSHFGKYRGVQRRTWATNLLLFRHAGAVVALLGKAGIPTLALKGAVVANRNYPHMSMRPMGDLDLMIRPDEVQRALGLLEAAGWRCAPLRPRDRADLAIGNAVALAHPRSPDVEIDLHWRLLKRYFSDEADADLWRRAVPFEIGGATALAPSPADLLLHTCAHGANFTRPPPLRWIADAAMILRGGEVEWEHLLVQSARYRLGLPLGIALGYLAGKMKLAVPATVLEALEREAQLPGDLAQFAFEQLPFERRSLVGWLRTNMHLARRSLGNGPVDYWRYFSRKRAGRSLGETVRWIVEHAGRRG
jgi:hypothetical protein